MVEVDIPNWATLAVEIIVAVFAIIVSWKFYQRGKKEQEEIKELLSVEKAKRDNRLKLVNMYLARLTVAFSDKWYEKLYDLDMEKARKEEVFKKQMDVFKKSFEDDRPLFRANLDVMPESTIVNLESVWNDSSLLFSDYETLDNKQWKEYLKSLKEEVDELQKLVPKSLRDDIKKSQN